MESIPNNNQSEKRVFASKQDAIVAFFAENEIDKLTFDTPTEAQAHVDMINNKYGDIAFVAEDRGGFAVKFREHHLGDGLSEYKGEGESDIEKAA
jgi:hypothetical protein